MICDLIYVVCALVVPLVVRPRWLVVALASVGCVVAGVLAWEAGLAEDVPPVMLIFGMAGVAVVVLGLALIVHAVKVACLNRWRAAR